MDLKEIINTPSASIVDVRTVMEYNMGHLEGSVNIPLDQVQDRVDELKNFSKPLILCCASGNRSGQATWFLKQQGMEEVYNGGGWAEVKGLQTQKA